MPRVSWTGDASSAERAQESLTKKAKEYNEALKGSAMSAKQLDAAARKVIELVDPQEKLNRKYAELGQLVKAGKISLEQATAAGVKFRQELGLAAKAGEQAVGNPLVSKLTLAVGAIGGVTAAVGFAKTAFGDLEEKAQAAADRIFNALGPIGELGQLGEDGPRGLAIARGLIRGGAVRPDNFAQAVGIAADLLNSPLNDQEIKFVTEQLGTSKLVAPENLTKVGGDLAALRDLFGEQSLESVTGRALEAAGKTRASLAITTREVLKYATLASSVGVSLDESLAAFEVSEGQSPSPEAAAEYQKSFFSQVKRRGLAKGDLQSTLDSIAAKIGKGNAFDVLGDANAVIGYEQLAKGRAELDRREREIGVAQFKRNEIFDQDPNAAAANVRSIEEGRYAGTLDDLETERENLFDAVRAAQRNRDARRGTNQISRYAFQVFDAISDALGFEQGAISGAYAQRNEPGFLDPETVKRIENYLARTAAAAEGTDNKVQSKNAMRKE